MKLDHEKLTPDYCARSVLALLAMVVVLLFVVVWLAA